MEKVRGHGHEMLDVERKDDRVKLYVPNGVVSMKSEQARALAARLLAASSPEATEVVAEVRQGLDTVGKFVKLCKDTFGG